MKSKHKKKIASQVAKEFWNNTTDENLKLRILDVHLNDYFSSSLFVNPCPGNKLTYEDLINLSKKDWAGLSLYDCDIPISHRRDSIYYHLGIGDFEGYPSNSKEYQREYKLRILKLKNE
jgi:hypothetical protein